VTVPTAIRKNDEVQVISGKDRGKRGRVVNVLPQRNRVMIEGIARATKHTRTGSKRATSGQQLQQGGIIQAEAFIDLSNVMLVCKNCGKPTRVGHREEAGVEVRICRHCESET
jgi:large subunit ribosomal protein L24